MHRFGYHCEFAFTVRTSGRPARFRDRQIAGVITHDRLHWQRRESMMTFSRTAEPDAETIRIMTPPAI
ncbi:MAG: hypothetical protein WEB58_14140 [Planctomycetaceae bacterium]